MKNFALMLLAAALVSLFGLPVLLGQIIRHIVTRRSLNSLWYAIAIGLDQLGGSILYSQPDWTISSRTYWLAQRGNRFARGFERVINLFFGEGHCQRSYAHEFGEAATKRSGPDTT